MSSIQELRVLVSEYVKDSIDLPQFAARFAVIFYDIENSGNEDAVQFSYRIESCLAKQSEGVVSTLVLRNSLAKLIEAHTSQTVIFTTSERDVMRVSDSGNPAYGYHQTDPIQALPTLVDA